MRATFNAIPPVKIVQTFVGLGKGKRGRAEAMWAAFGENTIAVMRDGYNLLAILWEIEWSLATVGTRFGATTCADRRRLEFAPSRKHAVVTIDQIGTS